VSEDQGYPTVRDMVATMSLGAERWLETGPTILVKLLTQIVLHKQYEENQTHKHVATELTTKKRMVKVMGVVMCMVTGVNLSATLTPAFVINTTLDLWGGPKCVEIMSQFIGCSASTVKNVWASQPPDQNTGLTRLSGLCVHSSDNLGMQKMVQRFCQALHKLKIKIYTASASFNLDPNNYIQYHPLADPALWLRNNRYQGDPMVKTHEQSQAQIREQGAWISHAVKQATGEWQGDSVTGCDPYAVIAEIQKKEKMCTNRWCHECSRWQLPEEEGGPAPTKCGQCTQLLSQSLKRRISTRNEKELRFHATEGRRVLGPLSDRAYTEMASSMMRDQSEEMNPQLHWSNPEEAVHRLYEKRSMELILDNPASGEAQMKLAEDAVERLANSPLGEQQSYTMDVPADVMEMIGRSNMSERVRFSFNHTTRKWLATTDLHSDAVRVESFPEWRNTSAQPRS
jgi:hypothetical protein